MHSDGLEKGKRTRSTIMQAAHQLFLEQGYHGTSMRQIAHDAGIALGGIYNHFDGKEAIFVEVLETYHPYHEILPILKNAQGETLEDFVRNAARKMIAALENRPDFFHLMFVEIIEFQSQHIPQLYQMFFPEVMDTVQRFTQEDDRLRPIPLPMIIRVFIGMFFSHYILNHLVGAQFPRVMQENALEYNVDIFLRGILA
jgi:AcrR family transcriptional regulator